MKIGAPLVMSVFTMLAASACGTQEQAAQAAPPPPVMNAQGEMAGEVSDTSVILQTRLTAVDGLTQDDVAGAPGVAQFEWSESPEFTGSTKTEWM
jgi:phosphodiesterase/alkaline phosphatase D-like protein